MASQETHTSVENHASSPIRSHEEEEEDDPAQLVAHITPKSPAQIVTIIKALVDQFCDWHHSQNPSQGKLVRRDVYPHLGLGLRKAEPRQNAYNTWLHHEGSKYKTSGPNREAFDRDHVNEAWEKFQQQEDWREKIALMEAENPSRSQVAKAAAKKHKRRPDSSEDSITHHGIAYYYAGLNELKQSFCDMAADFHSLFGIHSIIYMALDHEHASIKEGCLTAMSTKELESFLADMGREEPAGDAADMLRWLQFKNRQLHGLETSKKISDARAQFAATPAHAAQPVDSDASPDASAQSTTPLPPLYFATDESKRSRASKSILKTGKTSRSTSRLARLAEASIFCSADDRILEFDVKKAQSRQIIKAMLCGMLSLATNGRLGDISKILEWDKLHQDLYTSNLRFVNLPACLKLPGDPASQQQKSNTKPHNWTLGASNEFLQAIFHPNMERRCMLVCAASGLNPPNLLVSRPKDDLGVADGRVYDGFLIDDTQNAMEKCERCGACTNSVPLPIAAMGKAWPGIRNLLRIGTREKLLASGVHETADAVRGPPSEDAIDKPSIEGLASTLPPVVRRAVHFTPPDSSLAEAASVIPDSQERCDSPNIPAAAAPPNLSALAAHGSPSEHQAAGIPSFSPPPMLDGPTTEPDNLFDLSTFSTARTRPSPPIISATGGPLSQRTHLDTGDALHELAPPSLNALAQLQTTPLRNEAALRGLPQATNDALMTPASYMSAHLLDGTSNERTPLNLDAWLHPSVFTSPDSTDKPHAGCNEVYDFDEDYERRPLVKPPSCEEEVHPLPDSADIGRKRVRVESEAEDSDSSSEQVARLPKLPRLDLSSEHDELNSSVYRSGSQGTSGVSADPRQLQRQIAVLQAKLEAAQGRPRSASHATPVALEATGKTTRAGTQSIRASARESKAVGGAVTEPTVGRMPPPKPPLKTYSHKNRAAIKEVGASYPVPQEVGSPKSEDRETRQARPLQPFSHYNPGIKPSVDSPHRIAMQGRQDEAARQEEDERRIASKQLGTRRQDLVVNILQARNVTFVLERHLTYQEMQNKDRDYLQSRRECQEARAISESNIHEARAAKLKLAWKEKEDLVRQHLVRLRQAFLSQAPLSELEGILKNAL